MKKGWIWLGCTLLIAGSIAMWFTRPDEAVSVQTTVLAATSVEQTVSCNGVVEAVDGTGIFLPISCHIREVCVTPGQRVIKGDILAIIDKKATCEAVDDPSVRVIAAALDEEIIAPEDGIVTKVSAKTGESLKVGTPCVLMVRPADLRVRIAIREKDLRTLREGMRVRVSGDGLRQNAYEGTLTEIASTAVSNESATFVEGIVVPDAGQTDSSFRLGISAKATVITAVTENGYLVPYEALQSDEEGSYVYVLMDGTARIKRLPNAIQLPQGVLTDDATLEDVSIVLEPEKIKGDGQAVVEVSS